MGCSTKKKIASLCVSVWREREAERVWPDNRRKKIVGEHRKSRRRGSDRECYKLYCISPGKVIGLHLWCWAWTEHLSTATSAGNSHHDNPTQHNRVDLQAEDNSINTASGKHKTCHCRTTWPPAHMRRREMFPFCSGCRKSNHSKQHSVNAVHVISVCTAPRLCQMEGTEYTNKGNTHCYDSATNPEWPDTLIKTSRYLFIYLYFY